MKDKLRWRWFIMGFALFILQMLLLSDVDILTIIIVVITTSTMGLILFRGRPWQDDVRIYINWKWIGIGFVALWVVGYVSSFLGETTNQASLMDNIDTIGLVRFGVTVCLVAPLGEEIIYRRFLIGKFESWSRIIISGLVFGVIHTLTGFSWGGLITYSIPGMILGWIYNKRNNLLDSIVLHGLYNMSQLILLLLNLP